MPPTTPPVLLPRPRRRLLGALAGTALVASTLVAPTAASAAVPGPGALMATLLATVNSLRAAHGVPRIANNSALNHAAAGHTTLMVRHHALSSGFSGEPTVAQRIARAGYHASATAENVGVVTGPTQVGAWQVRIMSNPAARARVLNPSLSAIGLGVAWDSVLHRYWITEDFGQPTAVTANVADANALLTLMNQERAANGRPALRMNSLLQRSAHAHNLYMARYNTMSHQLSGEPFFATRILNAGYNYSTAGENIGWNADTSQSGVLVLQKIMYNEVPPDDGHRQNILNTTFRDVGIDVYFDTAHGKVWLTQDFGSLG